MYHSGGETGPLLKDKEAAGRMQERMSDKPERQTSWGWSKIGLKMKCMAQSRTDTLKIWSWLVPRGLKKAVMNSLSNKTKQNKTRALQTIHNCGCHTIKP